ncbi:LytTR family DNA-binding domain-containing protein [Bradyrhizobium sp. McL0616]|uniref:LytTR family DNA-binding domain-containing protein n=1 Tax=Bradyrhizobium sp. McL0616 TaxID=3415674 RepID=UPI003CEF16EB
MADLQNAPEREHVEIAWDQDRFRGDEAKPVGTSGWFGGIDRGDWTMFGAIAIVTIAIAVVNALSAAQDIAKGGGRYDLSRFLLWELSSAAVILLSVPILVLAVRRMRRTPKLASRAGIAAIALVSFATVHITGMVWIRKCVLWLAGGSYDFGLSLERVFYEFRKDLVTCLLLSATIWLIDSRRELLRERQRAPVATAAPAPGTTGPIWLRDGSSRIRVEPREIVSVSSAGNYIEYGLADGTTHLIRGTLATAEAELARFSIIRVHRMRLANLDRVTGVEFKPSGDFELILNNGERLQGSRRYRSSVASLGIPAAST